MNRTRWLTILVLCQVLVLLGTAASYFAVNWWGTEIRLKTEPVDPRDPLYGDYVTLHYKISDVSPDHWKREEPPENTPVHVLLTPKEGYWQVKSVHLNRPDPGKNEVVLKARASRGRSMGRGTSSPEKTLHLEYGLERYYVPEGTGRQFERARAPLTVRVKVAPWGQARIVDVEKKQRNREEPSGWNLTLTGQGASFTELFQSYQRGEQVLIPALMEMVAVPNGPRAQSADPTSSGTKIYG
ncbi:putative membrane-anchored protein [Melghirimyces profundicolus]|uniref:Putative membrane-anchored protein n=1 Tax=Melghirimyces profundicolus TaxID=1242148 RepID=A0A2T6BSW7_9BACL|nr:GDYXXLXY domain-containing protein [Melghirimyces profundicolus]PTX59154.1 putative membrane-anchored protein [Melghirimyces profundicolus]